MIGCKERRGPLDRGHTGTLSDFCPRQACTSLVSPHLPSPWVTLSRLPSSAFRSGNHLLRSGAGQGARGGERGGGYTRKRVGRNALPVCAPVTIALEHSKQKFYRRYWRPTARWQA